ncbi:NAD(P)H-dependent oxidoreductase [bacterium]|nr:NAD(P)H-dependent oxidoreductase [bacterium]
MSELDLVRSALHWRYAVKKFDAQKKIPADQWTVLKDSLRMSPSSYGLQPWQFVVVETPELRQKLREVSWNQSQVTDCSHYVVLTFREKVDPDFIRKNMQKIASVRGVAVESLAGFEKAITGDLILGPRSKELTAWAQRQVYIAMGFLLHTAGILKIDSTPMEGLDPAAYDELLGLKGSGWKTVAAVALGYRHAQDPFVQNKKVRFDENEVFVTK